MEMTGAYNGWLVILSIVVSIMASYTSLQVVRRMVNTEGRARYKWLTIGSMTFGGGIWAMHFVAMLAYDMNMPVTYDVWGVLISIFAAVTSSFIAFYLISRDIQKKALRLIGAILIACSIVSMHYIGMDAMQMNATISYNPFMIGLSVIIAFAVSVIGLRLFSMFAVKKVDDRKRDEIKVWSSSVFMGAAISGMHYTGMASATFYRIENPRADISGPAIDPILLGVLIAVGVLLFISFMMALTKFDAELKMSNSRLEIANEMYRVIVESANDAVITSNNRGIILSWNKAAEKTFGYRRDEVVGHSLTMIMPEKYRDYHNKGIERYNRTEKAQVIGKTVELEGLHKEGYAFPVELSLSSVKDEGHTYFTGIIRDITERLNHEKRIRELVYKDDLTQLPNRRALHDHLAGFLENAETLAVMFLDLDRFKQVNDVFGHRVGDLLLREGAERIQSCLNEEDLLARQSGDEFVIVMPNSDPLVIKDVTKEIIHKIAEPFSIDERDLYISGSVGISVYPEDGATAEQLIKRADTAMYQAKQNGGSQYYFFTKDMAEGVARELVLETDLRKALDREVK